MMRKNNCLIDLLSVGCPDKIKEVQDAHDHFQESIVKAVKQKADLYEYISAERKKNNSNKTN